MSTLTLSVNPAAEAALPAVDVLVEAAPEATVADLARALGAHLDPTRNGLLLAPLEADRVMPPGRPLAECGLRTGDLVDVVPVPVGWLTEPAADRPVRAVLRVVDGPDAGAEFRLTTPSVLVGRDPGATVRLTDPLVSGRHVRIDLAGEPTVTDEGSANGTLVAGQPVRRSTVLPEGALLHVGASTLVLNQAASAPSDPVAVHRSPRFGESLVADRVQVSAPPNAPDPQPMPWAMMLAPMLLGVALFAQSRNPATLTYVLVWPVMGYAGWWQQQRTARRKHERDLAAWRRHYLRIRDRVDSQAERQRDTAVLDHPETVALLSRAANRDGALWSRREGGPEHLGVRVGRGPVPALLTAELQGGETSDLGEEVRDELAARESVPDTPVLADLASCSLLAVVGPDEEVDAALRSLLTRLVLDHSPVDLAVAAVLSPGRAHHESWLRWLPHARPLVGGEPSVVLGAADGQRLLDRLVAEGAGAGHVLVVVDLASGVQQRAIEAAAAAASRHRLRVVVVGADPTAVPAATDLLLDLRAGTVSRRDRGGLVPLDRVDRLTLADAWRAARLVTSRVDEAAVLPADSALPGMVRVPDVMSDLVDLDDPEAIVRRWASSTGLRAQIGAGVDGVATVDLRDDGPHGLVAGTTGSGKSELLQTLLCSLAANTPPQRVTFLLVDYKGGAAFRECADLPHTVGYLTDLTPALVQRALTSLGAEIATREELLAEHGAKDLVHLERIRPDVAPPSLLICIDEFAALTAEVPEFVDGMVNLAQRGRSLGMHLLLATQRPAGVVTAAIRANTDLRIALRIASDDDSRDVIDAPDAARISRRTPGRAWVRRTGHGTADLVQTAWVGARQPLAATRATVAVHPFTATLAAGGPVATAGGRLDPRTDLERLVATIRTAYASLDLPAPRRPWLPALAPVLDLPVAERATTPPGVVRVGLVDDPERQLQPHLDLDYAAAGHVLVHGASGSGKTELLRTVAVAASLDDTSRGGSVPPYVYGLDFAGGGLSVLENLPTVASVVGEAQTGRVLRLIRLIRTTVEDRNRLLAASGAADLVALAQRTGRVLPRVHLLIDNLPALLDHLDTGGALRRQHADQLTQVLQSGRRVGVHVTASTPGRTGIPATVASAFGARVILRMPVADDYLMLGAPANLLGPESPPGSALVGRRVAQLATLGGLAGTVDAGQLDAVADLLRPAVADRPRALVPGMPTRVPASAMPAPEGTTVAVGVDADAVAPVCVDLLSGPILVAGRARSGRTAVLDGLLALTRRSDTPPAVVVRVGAPARAGETGLASLEDVLAWAAERPDPVEGWDLVLVDDAHLLDSPPDPEAVAAFVAEAARRRVALVVAADVDLARGPALATGLLPAVRRGGRGLLLQGDGLDGTVLGVTLPMQTLESPTGPGRGFWCDGGQCTLVHAVVDLEPDRQGEP